MKEKNVKQSKKTVITSILSISVIILLAVLTGLILYLFVDISSGFIAENALLIKICGTAILAILCATAIVFQLVDKNFVIRLVLSCLVFAVIILGVLYVLQLTNFWDKVSSVEELRNYISQFGGYAVLIAFIMQVLQVVVLPVPGFIAIGATVALFGSFKGALISFAGIMAGSLIAFFVGRVLGYKVASWLVGKQALNKGINSVKGKDRVVLTFMFLFPFFPDDVLCFVAGLSSMSKRYFIIMVTITRLISVFTTAYSVDGKIIPYDTWWGLLIWAVLIIGSAIIGYFVYKNGEKIETFFMEKLFKKNKKQKNEESNF